MNEKNRALNKNGELEERTGSILLRNENNKKKRKMQVLKILIVFMLCE